MCDGEASSAAGGTFVNLLRHRADHQAEQHGYLFLTDGEQREAVLTYSELDRQARILAACLQDVATANARIVLLFPPGLAFIAGFMGCLYAGMTAVPAYPPRSARHDRTAGRLQTTLRDARPAALLTTAALRPAVQACAADAKCQAPVIAADTLPDHLANDWRMPALRADQVACIQYTSGSTASPKGVMLTHANLMHTSAVVAECFEHTPRSRGVIWLPPYHDMGLFGGILQPLYVGFPVTLMAPAAFLQKPIRWLRAISRYGGTTSGGPNFAYDLCVRSIGPDECDGLDLSRWEVAFNGAEPVRAATIDRFTQVFESIGFRREAFYPCYGLAEATLIVSGGDKGRPITRRPHGGDGHGTIVGCGRSRAGDRILIAHPETAAPLNEGEVGEVWVHGGGVAQGYFGQPEESQRVFHARLAAPTTDGAAYLRTGDLGFLQAGEIFITGRLRDLIVIRGVNHHPHDLEACVQARVAALAPGAGAAFGVPGEDGDDVLVIVQEVHRTHRRAVGQDTLAAIQGAVAEGHGVQPHAIVIAAPGAVPRTPSGKVQRQRCRALYLAGELDVIVQWTRASTRDAATAVAADAPPCLSDAPTVARWLTHLLAQAVGAQPDDIDPTEPFARYGLDSAAAVGLAGYIAEAVGHDLDATLFWDYPDIESLAAHLVATANSNESAVSPHG